MAEWEGIHFMGMYGCIYLFSPLSHSRSAAFGDAAVRPAADIPMGLFSFADKIVTAVFPYLGPSLIPKPFSSPHLPGAMTGGNRVPEPSGAPALGSPCVGEGAARAPEAAA